MDSSSHPVPRSLRGWLFVALMLIGSLVALTGLRQFFIEPLATATSNGIWFVVQLLPLLLPLPGLLHTNLRATFILCMTSMLYFIHGVYVISDPKLTLLGAFEIGFALALCAVCALMVRKLREAAAQAPPTSAEELN